MRKIITSLATIALVVGVVIAVTGAYFSDTETSTGNTFTAGTLNLRCDTNDGVNTVVFSLTDKAPGDAGSGTWTLNNNGSLDGYLDLENISVGGSENYNAAVDEAEAYNATTNPTGDTNTAADPELAANLDVVLFWDDGAGNGIAGNGIQDGTEATIYSGKLSDIADSYNTNYLLTSGSTTYVSMTWSIATTVGNLIQGDSATLNITFELAQTTGQ